MLLYLISFLPYKNMFFFHLSSQGISLSPERGLGWTSRTIFLNRPVFHLNMCWFKWPCSTGILNPFSLLLLSLFHTLFHITEHTHFEANELSDLLGSFIISLLWFGCYAMAADHQLKASVALNNRIAWLCSTAAQFSLCEKENHDLDKLRAKQKRQYHCVINGI